MEVFAGRGEGFVVDSEESIGTGELVGIGDSLTGITAEFISDKLEVDSMISILEL